MNREFKKCLIFQIEFKGVGELFGLVREFWVESVG